jgi:HTH-type transcriptional regulator/antitoxin MqsA
MTHHCLQCDDGTELIYKKHPLTVHYHEYTAEVADVAGWHCPVCGECEFADKADSRRYMDRLNALIAQAKSTSTSLD